MENFNSIKTIILSISGAIGGFFANMFGGWDMLLKILLMLMAIDYATGLMVAGVFHVSTKSESGTLDSKAGWQGLFKKGVTLCIMLVAVQVDSLAGSEIVRDGVAIAYAINEAISIIENADAMGIWIPEILRNAIGSLQEKNE